MSIVLVRSSSSSSSSKKYPRLLVLTNWSGLLHDDLGRVIESLVSLQLFVA
jgi:hypothetical protein